MIIDLFINGKKMNFHNPSDSMAQGIGMVQQHFMLFESMTVAENIVYKNEMKKGVFFDYKKNIQMVEELSKRYMLKVVLINSILLVPCFMVGQGDMLWFLLCDAVLLFVVLNIWYRRMRRRYMQLLNAAEAIAELLTLGVATGAFCAGVFCTGALCAGAL